MLKYDFKETKQTRDVHFRQKMQSVIAKNVAGSPVATPPDQVAGNNLLQSAAAAAHPDLLQELSATSILDWRSLPLSGKCVV